jgi:hypothetical protein
VASTITGADARKYTLQEEPLLEAALKNAQDDYKSSSDAELMQSMGVSTKFQNRSRTSGMRCG